MLDGVSQANKLEKDLLEPISDPSSKKIVVYNTCSWKRSGPVTFSATTRGKSVKCPDGSIVPLQLLSSGNYIFIAKDVPALGCATYQILNEDAPFFGSFYTNSSNEMSNELVTFGWSFENGSITDIRMTDKYNYAGIFNKQGLNSYWYEAGLNPADAVTNGHVKVKWIEEGRVISTLSITSEAPGTNGLERRISLVAGSNEVRIDNMVDKKMVRNKESIHFAFPFNSELNRATLDAGYGSMRYLNYQLAGSNVDYLYGRRWMDVSSGGRGIQMMMLEIPLVEPGGMADERLVVNQGLRQWKKENAPTSTWFSYAMNNYWHTNYKADQEGIAHFKYCLRPHGPVAYDEMERAAEEFTQPLIAIPVKDQNVASKSLFELNNNLVVVTSITPLRDGGFMVRFYNTAPRAQQTGFVWKSFQPTNLINKATGQKSDITGNIILEPMGVSEYIIR